MTNTLLFTIFFSGLVRLDRSIIRGLQVSGTSAPRPRNAFITCSGAFVLVNGSQMASGKQLKKQFRSCHLRSIAVLWYVLMLHGLSFRFCSRLKTTPDRDLQKCNAASLPFPWPILLRVIYEDWGGLLNSVEFGLLLTTANCRDPNVE